jgi:hypothetical protein
MVENSPDAQTPTGDEPPPTTKRKIKALAWAVTLAMAVGAGTWAASHVLSGIDRYDTTVTTNLDAIESARNLGGGEYLFNIPIQDVGTPPGGLDTCNGRYTWAHEKHGIDAGSTLMRISISARKDHEIRLVGVQKTKASSKSPSVGSLTTCPGRGASPVRHISYNLDTDEKVFFDGESEEPVDLNLPIEGGKTEVIDLQAVTEQHLWSYKLELTLIVDGEKVKEIIDDSGKPFITSAATNAKHYRWIENEWIDVTPGSGAAQKPVSPGVKVSLPDACSLVTADEAKGVMGKELKVADNFKGDWSPSQTGRQVYVDFCSYATDDMDSVQITATESESRNLAEDEYGEVLKQVDPDGKARDLAGFTGNAKIIGGTTAVFHRNKRTVMVVIVRKGNILDPLDERYVTRLMMIAAQRV